MQSVISTRASGDLANATSFDQAAAASLLIRLSLGAMWLSHALLKLLVFTPAGTSAFFESVGLPGWITWPAILAELIGGALIIAGWRGRLVSVLLLPILLGAAWIHWPNGWVFSAKGGGWEYPVFLAAMSLVHALSGDGRYSVDAVLRRGN
jgi:putative oxidoreductase